ncbi:CLUMA_CG015950, isoform A [Clunio marinus]|uniref:CLUMA_CG015950, isoform A n=1 Tax=Clunio marinus TaxID=568069 RepID=A0A1J1IQP9_9DIPT|nr:CLUMA_CG015950, isoform A [Clunio marinus]
MFERIILPNAFIFSQGLLRFHPALNFLPDELILGAKKIHFKEIRSAVEYEDVSELKKFEVEFLMVLWSNFDAHSMDFIYKISNKSSFLIQSLTKESVGNMRQSLMLMLQKT